MDASFREWLLTTLTDLRNKDAVVVQGDATVPDPTIGPKLDAIVESVGEQSRNILSLTQLYQQNFAATALISYLLFLTSSFTPPPGMKEMLEQQLGFTLPDPPA